MIIEYEAPTERVRWLANRGGAESTQGDSCLSVIEQLALRSSY
jgi:hypothetical protein